jgi:hypothetical protein
VLTFIHTIIILDGNPMDRIQLLRDIVSSVEIKQLLETTKWENSEIHGTLTLVWQLALQQFTRHSSKESIESAIATGGLEFVYKLLTSSTFVQDTENISIFCSVIDRFCCSFIINELDIASLSSKDEMQANWEKVLLFRVMTELYLLEPEEAWKFWQETSDGTIQHHFQHRMMSFLKLPFGTSFPVTNRTECFVSYINCLAAMAGSELGAAFIYRHLLNSTITGWDHFFGVLSGFVNDFRQLQTEPRLGGRSPQFVGLSEAETAHLVAILGVIESVVRNNSDVRAQICENPKWGAIATLFDFVGCHIPLSIKAAIMRALAGFAMSPEIANAIWPSLEVPRAYPRTIRTPGTNTKLVHMVRYELETVEAVTKDFSFSLGFLMLLKELLTPEVLLLVDVSAYLEFVRHVFFRFADRDSDMNQLWNTGVICLEIFHNVLQVSPMAPLTNITRVALFQPIIPQGTNNLRTPLPLSGSARASSNIALNLIVDFFSTARDTSMFHRIMWIIQQGETNLRNQRISEKFGNLFEKAVLLSLHILERVLEQEENTKEFCSHRFAHPLSQVLLQLETGSYVANVASFLNYPYSPKLPLSAIRILILLSQSKANLRARPEPDKIAAILHRSKYKVQQILSELLERPESSDEWDQVKEAVLVLLLRNRKSRAPNLTQYLLGFGMEPSKMKSVDVSQLPGSCLSVLLELLSKSPSFGILQPYLCEMFYRLLFELCSDRFTGEAVLSYLRRFSTFLQKQISELAPLQIPISHHIGTTFQSPATPGRTPATPGRITPIPGTPAHLNVYPPSFPIPGTPARATPTPGRATPASGGLGSQIEFSGSGNENLNNYSYSSSLFAVNVNGQFSIEEINSCLLLQRSWLLQIIALELHLNTSDRRRSAQKLLDFLFDSNSSSSMESDRNLIALQENLSGRNSNSTIRSSQVKIIELLDSLCVPLPNPSEIPVLFDIQPDQFRIETTGGFHVFDLESLAYCLESRCKCLELENAAVNLPWREQRREQISQVLQAVQTQNQFFVLLAGKMKFFESWKSVVEIGLHEYFDHIRSQHPKLLYDLIDTLVNYFHSRTVVLSRDPLLELISGCILSLLSKLGALIDFRSSTMSSARDLPVVKLHSILQGLIKALFSHGTSQQMRGNFYTSLLYYLQFTHFQLDRLLLESNPPGKVWWLISELEANQRLIYGNIDILEYSGEKLIELICHDAADGLEVWKAASFALLDSLISFDKKQNWLRFLEQRGFLRHFIEEIYLQDQALQQSLLSPDLVKIIYVYESKMSLLLHLAQSQEGAAKLVQLNLLEKLSQCSFYDSHPEIQMNAAHQADSRLASVIQHYHQLLYPVLELLVCLLSRLAHVPVVLNQITKFVRVHSDLFFMILRDRRSFVTLQALRELRLTVAIFYHIAGKQPKLFQEQLQSKAAKFQQLLLQLIPKYFLEQRVSVQLKELELFEDLFPDIDANPLGMAPTGFQSTILRSRREILGICQNLIAYCRAFSFSESPRPVLFSFAATNSDAYYEGNQNLFYCFFCFFFLLFNFLFFIFYFLFFIFNIEDSPMITSARAQPPSLAILVEFLKRLLSDLTARQKEVQDQQEKLKHVNELSAEELKQFVIPTSQPSDNLERSDQIHLARTRLQELLAENYSWIASLECL